MLKGVSLVAFCCLVAGCWSETSHQGTDLTKLDGSPIVRDTTTETELVHKLGKPESSVNHADGSRTMVWTESTMKIPGGAGQPFGVGPHMTKTERTLTATVKDGVVVDYAMTDTAPQQPNGPAAPVEH